MKFVIEAGLMFVSIIIITIIRIFNRNPPAIFNIYQRPNGFYWFKVLFMYFILSIKKLYYPDIVPAYSDYVEAAICESPSSRFCPQILQKLQKLSNQNELYMKLEQPQPLSSNPKAIDAVYFNGSNAKEDFLVTGTARRKNKLVDGFFYLFLNESPFGLLESPKLPDTALYQEEITDEYTVEGISLTPILPMKKWSIKYEGKMKLHRNREETVDVKLDAKWCSTLPYFNFDSDLDPWCLAKSMAYETFSREYFKNLKLNHQTHYEQHGDITGTAIINNVTYNIDLNAVRDHTFGLHREWRQFHRYALHFFTTQNGDRFHVGKVCFPICFSRLTLGYVYAAEDNKIYPVKWCDLELYQHGEDGQPPTDYAFSFQAGPKVYNMKVRMVHSPHFYISKDWESRVVEGLCSFEVNGVRGWGAAEWQYRNVNEKNVADYNGQ